MPIQESKVKIKHEYICEECRYVYEAYADELECPKCNKS